MKRALLALFFSLATGAFATTRIIPVAGHTPGGNGTVWTTDLALKNDDTTSAVVTLAFRADDGSEYTRTVTLPAGQSMLLQDAANPFFYAGAGRTEWLGQLEIRSTANVSATADIHTTTADGGTFGSSFASYDPRVLSSHGYLSGLLSSPRFRTNIAFANATDAKESIAYTVRRPDGTLASSRRIEVDAHRTVQLPLAIDFTSTDDQPVLVEWISSAPAYVIASIVDNRSGDPTGVPSVASGTTTLSFPLIGKTPGGIGSFWTTSATVSSLSDAPGSVTFVYQSNDGTLYSKSVALGPRATFRTDDINALVGAPNGSGTLRIDATIRVVGSVRVFNTQSSGATFGSAVLPQEPSARAASIRISGVRRDASFRLNVAVANDDDIATDGTIRLFDSRARELETHPFHLDAHRTVQVSLASTTDDVEGGDVLVETKNGVAVTVLASTVDNRTGDTKLAEVEQEDERQTELDVRISPATITAGTSVSFTVVGGSAAITNVAWRFGDGTTATGLNVTHIYAAPSEYEVFADVTLAGGIVVHEREDIQVLPNGTTGNGLDFEWTPAAPGPGQTVTFRVNTETTFGGSYIWTFPNGEKKSGSTVTYSFATAGNYEVEVELERSGSTVRRTSHLIRVGTSGGSTGANTVDFTWAPASPRGGESVTFTATFDNQPLAGSVVKWRFPDDSRPQNTTARYTFAAAGTYTVRVQLEQPGRTTIEREKSVVVAP